MLIAERYRLGTSLGRGGMGEVYRATDETLGREVAVKLMLRSSGHASAVERFQREARAAARLTDPHIVAVYDFGEYDDTFYLVMELVEGKSVAAELEESGSLSWDRAVAIVEQAATGLAAAHAQNVVHRDIKPSNLLVTSDGVVKVADFGIAHVSGADKELTVTGELLGSPHYLSPERARGEQGGPESDVYSLGCVLYQLVTGRPPFVGDHPTAVLYQHVDTPPVPPADLRPELAGPYEGVLLRMLAKDPEERPTAEQLTDMARAAELFPPIDAVVPVVPVADPTVPVTPTQVVPAAGAQEAAQEAAQARSRKPLLIAVASLLVIAGAIAAAIGLRNTGDDLPPTVDVGPQPTSTTPSPTGGPTTTAPTTSETSRETQTTRNTPSATPSDTPSATPSATPSDTPSATPSETPSDTPSPTPTPTRTSTSTPPSNTPSPTPTPTPTPEPSNTPPPSSTPTP
ncbi:serine/threonine-protein kinase [Kribbella sp. NPDC048915]|uniref:serine/threonine-protein kinase n=1 Tax=Kribbella sp. NPDC048915 TaxID=3155148 RepID=UPI0033CD8022